MRILITGGAGFIGSHIVDALVARGDEVVVLDDLSTGSRAHVNERARLVVGDITDAAVTGAITGRLDAVLHLAAKTKVVESFEKQDLYRRVIVDGTRAVLAIAERCRARVFVNISSGGAGYGETPVCATEETPARPDSPYGRFKLEAEGLLDAATIRGVTLRLANVYGPRQRGDLEGGVVAIFLERWRATQRLTVFGDGRAERDYVHVDDVVAAALAGVERDVRGAYNIGTGVATSVNGLIAAMAAILGPVPGVDHAPARPGELQRSCLDAGKAARDGLWKPVVALAEGLRQTASSGVG